MSSKTFPSTGAKPAFDPNQPYEEVGEEQPIVSGSKPEFDPNKPYEEEVKKNGLPQSALVEHTEPSKDLLTLARERKEAQSKISTLSSPSNISAPGGYVPVPNTEGYKKQLAEANEAIKAQGGDEQLAEDIWDIPQGQGFSFVNDIPGLMAMRNENSYAYNRELGAIKSKGNLYNAIRDQSDIQTANNVIQGLQLTEKQDFRQGTKDGIALIRRYIDDSDEQQKLIKNYITDKSYDYGLQPVKDDERFINMNPYQQRAMRYLEDVDPATFQAYQKILSVNPDEQWMGSKESDIRRGSEMKGRELENIGMNLQMKAIEERLTNLKNKIDKGEQLTPEEKQEYTQRLSDYQTLASDKENQNQRYPTQAVVDADQLMQESIGGRNSIAKKFALGVGENFDDAVNWVGDLLQEKGIIGDLELLGDKQLSGLNRYTAENDKIIGSQFVAKFDNELQQQIDEIKKSGLSDDQKQENITKLILNNQDKVSYVANDKGGKSNFTSKSVMNTVGDVASDLVSQLAIATLAGGATATTKLGRLSSLFGSTFSTAYNDYYNQALQQNIPNPTQYALTNTTIEAASELINDDFEVAKRMIGKSSTLGKVLHAVSKGDWDQIAKKGLFSKLKDAALQTGKTAIKNALKETEEEIVSQVGSNISDQQIFNRETGIGEGVKETMIQTFIGMVPLGLLSLPFNYNNINRTQKYAMYEAGMNPSKFIEAIDKGVADGLITPQKAKEQKESIEKIANAISSSASVRTDGNQMTDNEKTEFAFNKTVLNEINEQKKEATPETKEQLEKKEEEINKKQEELVKPKPTPEQELVNKALEKDEIKGAAKAALEEAAKNPQDLNDYLKEISEQANDPLSEKQAIETFGEQIVNRAKELHPISETNNLDAKINEINKRRVEELNQLKKQRKYDSKFTKPIHEKYDAEIAALQPQEQNKEEGVIEVSQPESLQPSLEETQHQTGGQEIVINNPEDLDREISKVFESESKAEAQTPKEATQKKETAKKTIPPKEKKTKPTLNKKEQEQADYAYQNSYPYFKKKYPDVNVDEYNMLRSLKRQQGLPKLGEINKGNNQRPVNEDTSQYTTVSIIKKAREFYENDLIINKVLDLLEPIIKANPNIKIDTEFQWDKNEYEGHKIINQALGYSFPSGNIILNFNTIIDYDTLFRTALHELVHAATRNEINTNKVFNSDLKKVLADVRRAMKLPEGDTVLEALVRDGVISKDIEEKYGATNEHELLAEVFSNEKFYNFLKGLEYKGDNLLHRLFLAIAKFFSENYKKIAGAKKSITADNLADYLIQLTGSVIGGQQQQSDGMGAMPLIRPSQTEVLKKIISKAIGKISEDDIRGKLKQIAGLTDQEIDDLMSEVGPAAVPVAPDRILTEEEIGNTPTEAKKKSAIRKFREKYFDRAKGMPDWLLSLKDKARGSVHLEVRQALQLVDKVRKIAKQIGFNDWELFDKALRGQYYGSDFSDLESLPPELQILNVQMRNKIDSLSRDLIINNYVTPEQALNIESNIGEYMTRSYRAFNEKNWGKKVPQEARDDAYRLLTQNIFNELLKVNEKELADGDITEDELIEQAKQEAFRELQSIIDGINDKYTPTKVNVEKGKDLGILKQRKDIPKEIREVLGEYTDPGVNFAMTVARIASLKSNAAYLTSIRDQGMGEILWEADTRPPEASVQIASDGSETWSPLNGLYTTPEIKEIFKESEATRNKWVQRWLTAVGAIKWGKTVGSLVTQIKNFESNLGFALMNGHYRAGKSSQSFKFLKDKLFRGEKSQDAMIEKVIGLGIVDQSVGVRELRDMFAKDNLDHVIIDSSIKQQSALRKLGSNLIGKPIKYLNKVYAASDDFWKVYGFLNEAESLSQATYNRSYKELTDDEQANIDTEASERVKNTYPTYDRVWEGAKSISKGLPIFGNFLSFQAESIRVLLNTFNYAIKDVKTPGRQLMGAQRLAGIGAYLGARSMILYTIAQMTGVGMAGLMGLGNDDEEEQKLKDINRYSPDFIRSGDKLAIDHGEGNYTVYDVGGLEPYGLWFKTMNAFTEGNDIVKGGGIGASVTELLSPFVEPEMSFKLGLNLYNNENDFGSRIYNPMDNFGDQMLDAMAFTIKKSKPSTIDFIQRVYKNDDKKTEISAAFGGRGYKVETVKSFSFKLKAAEELFDANRDAMNKVKYNPTSTEEEIKDAEIKYEERTTKIIKMLAEDYHAAMRLGADIGKLDEVLDRKKFFQGYNKDVKNQIKAGVFEDENIDTGEIKEWQP